MTYVYSMKYFIFCGIEEKKIPFHLQRKSKRLVSYRYQFFEEGVNWLKRIQLSDIDVSRHLSMRQSSSSSGISPMRFFSTEYLFHSLRLLFSFIRPFLSLRPYLSKSSLKLSLHLFLGRPLLFLPSGYQFINNLDSLSFPILFTWP